MPIRTLAASEEDIVPASALVIDTAEKAYDAALRYARAIGDQEWLIGLCLNPSLQLIDCHLVFQSDTCRSCPPEALEGLISTARGCQCNSLLPVRYHAHPWRGPRRKGILRFEDFYEMALARGIILRDLVVADSTGEVYSLRGEPVSASSSQPLIFSAPANHPD